MASGSLKLASRIEALHSKIRLLKSLVNPDAICHVEDCLRQENQALETKISDLLQKIVDQELRFGVFQYKVPVKATSQLASKVETSKPVSQPTVHQESMQKNPPSAPSTQAKALEAPSDSGKAKPPARTKTDSKTSGGGRQPAATCEAPVDVGRLDMRVGRIMEVSLHPDADSLYVEKVDLGEGRLRTVVSGLVKFVPIESLQNRVGIFMCNLKPAKMRGVESEAMLMCASAPEAGGVEPLVIDSEAVSLGDSVIVPGYEHNPDAQLNPKKKIFEQVKPDLRVDPQGFATYKGARWTLKSAPGVSIKAERLKDVQIA